MIPNKIIENLRAGLGQAKGHNHSSLSINVEDLEYLLSKVDVIKQVEKMAKLTQQPDPKIYERVAFSEYDAFVQHVRRETKIDVQTEAVKLGLAYYTCNERGETTFHWGSPQDHKVVPSAMPGLDFNKKGTP